ncbi:hypothetical protein [Streptomyces sp. NRRL WC-3618]|uniref:hypothetical protein n=1 Tax=Streptomyces sp. NRRL WC-3618 TaxID=1519490 RepID=UPI002D21A823|nr:hypothetical protein [Streptomyces sp. NRRL WC-3618]
MSLVLLNLSSYLGKYVVHPKISNHGVPLRSLKDDGRVCEDEMVKDPVAVPQNRDRR